MASQAPTCARDIMSTQIRSLDESQTIASASEALERMPFRHMPVTDGDRLLGLISDRDLLRVDASTAVPNSSTQAAFIARTLRVKDVMAKELTTVGPGEPLVNVAMLMRTHKLGCLPVVEDGNRLVGLITEADFVALAQNLLEGA